MTVAVIIATGPAGPHAALERLRAPLATANVPDVRVIARPGTGGADAAGAGHLTESADLAGDLRELARIARRANVPVLVLPGDLVAGPGVLDRLAGGTGAPLAAVTVPHDEAGAYGTATARVRRGRIVRVAAGTKANAGSPGVLRFAPSEAAAVADVADQLAGQAARGAQGDTVALLLAGLVRAGRKVAALPVRGPGHGEVCRRVTGPDQAAEAEPELLVARLAYEDRKRLEAAAGRDDGLFAGVAVGPYSPHLVRWLARREIAPNTVTAVSMALALLAAMWFSDGSRAAMVLGSVLFYASFVLDRVDGRLARYTGAPTPFGAWLDAVCDRAKEFAVYIGLAMGSAAQGTDVWGLAAAALVLQTVRQMLDHAYQAQAAAPPGPRERPRLRWARTALALPAGERCALIIVTAVLFGPRVTFLALLTWGGLAAAYTLAGRTRRALAA